MNNFTYSNWDDAIVRVLGDNNNPMKSIEIADIVHRKRYYNITGKTPQNSINRNLTENYSGFYVSQGNGYHTLSSKGKAHYQKIIGNRLKPAIKADNQPVQNFVVKTDTAKSFSKNTCNYSAIALHLNPRLKYTAKRPIKRQNKVSIFLAYVRYFLYLYTYERASYGHIKSAARHDGRDAVDA